jgi:hypothetical protein
MHLMPPPPPTFNVENFERDECFMAGINKRPSMSDALPLTCSNFELGGERGCPPTLVLSNVGVYLSRTGVKRILVNVRYRTHLAQLYPSQCE